MKPHLLFIGHRGSLGGFDENTPHAFNKAIECGADYIELDVRATKDNKLIVIHDSNLKRTTNGIGEINEMNYKDIIRFRTKVTHCRIPLLSEVLDQFKNTVKFIIDIKTENIWEAVAELIQKNNLLDSCILSGRYLKDLRSFKSQNPQGKICYNITKGIGFSFSELVKKECVPNDIDLISASTEILNSKFIEICHDNETLTLTWKFNNYKDSLKKIKRSIKMGIDGVLFDSCFNIPIIKQWLSNKYN
ncbi:MAG: glycerophosphodiester phosphodiesterase [Promethearchaeota archaeon]